MTYKVANPRRIENAHVLVIGNRAWYEGDDFTPPKGMRKDAVSQLLKLGVLAKQEGDESDG